MKICWVGRRDEAMKGWMYMVKEMTECKSAGCGRKRQQVGGTSSPSILVKSLLLKMSP